MSNINNLNVEMSSLQIFILFAVKKNTSQIFFTKKKKKEQVSNKWNVKTFAYSCKLNYIPFKDLLTDSICSIDPVKKSLLFYFSYVFKVTSDERVTLQVTSI